MNDMERHPDERPVVYLASPYSAASADVREWRWRMACRWCAMMANEGFVVWSPIATAHPLVAFGVRGDWEFWRRQDLHFLGACDELWVLMLDGWLASRGVCAEMESAIGLGMPVRYVDPNCDGLCVLDTPPDAGLGGVITETGG
jgi:nucleoside 2-deoxyribosyltransferase